MSRVHSLTISKAFSNRACMKGSAKVVILLLLASIVLVVAIYQLRPKPKTRPLSPPKPPIVSVIEATAQTHQVVVSTQGTVAPKRQIELVAEVSGRVVSVADHFVAGGFFSANQALVKLDDRDYRYTVVNRAAQVANAERDLALEQGQARQAKREWRDLGSTSANALSLRQPQVKAAKAQLSAAIALRDQAKLDLKRTSITPPFSGRIQMTHVDVGQYIAPGTPIATIYDDATAEIRLPLTDQQAALIGLPLSGAIVKTAQPKVMLSTVLAGQQQQWPATITRTEATLDATTRLYYAIAEVPAPFDQQRYPTPLMMGLFVDAAIQGITFDNVIRVPQQAVLKNKFIFIVGDDNTLEQKEITVVTKDKNIIWFRAELNQNKKIIISDAKALRPGMQVTQKAAKGVEL